MSLRPRRIFLAVALIVGAVVLRAGNTGAEAARGGAPGAGIQVAQLNGLIDPPNASLLRATIRDANRRRASLLVIQLNSGGAVDADARALVRAIRASKVPIAVWVGPSGAGAKGAAVLLAQAASVASIANGAGIGPAYPVALDDPDRISRASIGDELAELAVASSRNPSGARRTTGAPLSAERARAVGAVNSVEPTLGELVVSLDGQEVATPTGRVKLSTARVVGQGRERRREPNQTVHFRKLGLGGQIEHTLTSPSIAYFLFVVGLALIAFEFFTAAIGLAGATGALAFVGAFVGFSHLPIAWWAVALLALGIMGFSIDAQASVTGGWTVIGVVALIVGSLTLYGGSSRLDVRWWVVVVVCGATVLFMLAAVPAAIRSRFSTPTVGREAMIGEMGTAEVEVNPDGVVLVRGARWRARTNRATPIPAGGPVRVVEVEGLVLEVEPEDGGARDYREQRRREQPDD